jgi:flagellar FliL protein
MAAEEKEKGGKGKLIGIIGGVVVLAAGGFFFFMGGSSDAEENAPPPEEEVVAEGAVIEADTMTFNLAGDESRYARVTFAVVLPEGGDSAAVGERMPLLKDAALQIMAEYTAADLSGTAGLDRLREELTKASASVYADGEVLRVVLTEVLVQ